MIKRRLKYVVALLLLIEVSFCFLTYKSYSYKEVDKINEENKINKEMFAMYVENEEGKYEEYKDGETFTIAGYKLNVSKSNCVDNKGKLVPDIILSTNNKVTISSNKTVFCYLYFDIKGPDITLTISNNGINGTLPKNSNYKTSVSCDSADIEYNFKYHRVEINSGTSDEVKCSLDYSNDINIYPTLIGKVESEATINENGYRYSGKQPDNWLWFNNEKWRIIGSIPTKQSDGTETNLVKIIRSESIGGLAFDNKDSTAIWGKNTLYTLLNEKYYGKVDATGASPCFSINKVYSLCNYKEIGISNESTDYYGSMIKDVYWNVGIVSSSATIISTAYEKESGTQSTIMGKVGLMNASDYGYATSGIIYNSIKLSELSSYEQDNWLFTSNAESTLTPNSSSNILSIGIDGAIASYYRGAYTGYEIRPVLYLDSSVYVKNGSGNESEPYTIGM